MGEQVVVVDIGIMCVTGIAVDDREETGIV